MADRQPKGVRYLLAKMEPQASGCIWYTGRVRPEDGYTRIGNEGAHRVSYRHFIGPIPEGMDVDHECHNHDESCGGGPTCLHRRCVNPDHLRAVSHEANVLAGRSFAARNARKTHCDNGHEYTPENTRLEAGGRRCLTCQREREAGRSRSDRKAPC